MPPLFQIPTTINLSPIPTITRDNSATTRPHVPTNHHSQSPPQPLSTSNPVRQDFATFETPVSPQDRAFEHAARSRWAREGDRVVGKGAARRKREARAAEAAVERKKARAAERRKERAREREEEVRKAEVERRVEEERARGEARVRKVRAMRRARAREPERLRRVAERVEWGVRYTAMVAFEARVASGTLV